MLRSSLRSSQKLQSLASQSPAPIPIGVVNEAFATEESKPTSEEAPSNYFKAAFAIKKVTYCL